MFFVTSPFLYSGYNSFNFLYFSSEVNFFFSGFIFVLASLLSGHSSRVSWAGGVRLADYSLSVAVHSVVGPAVAHVCQL